MIAHRSVRANFSPQRPKLTIRRNAHQLLTDRINITLFLYVFIAIALATQAGFTHVNYVPQSISES